MSEQQGKFITIEGQDGAGKTTNLDFICQHLSQNEIPYTVTREPGGTELGESIRKLLLGQNIPIVPISELLLMFAARAQHIEQVIKPALNAGKWVVCDRFTDATYAYQGGGHELDRKLIQQAEALAINNFSPDLTLLLDLDIAVGAQRSDARGETKDRFEKQANEFKSRVREAYLYRQSMDPVRIKLIDAATNLSVVQESIKLKLDKFIAQVKNND